MECYEIKKDVLTEIVVYVWDEKIEGIWFANETIDFGGNNEQVMQMSQKLNAVCERYGMAIVFKFHRM